MYKYYLDNLIKKEDMKITDFYDIADSMLTGKLTQNQIASLITAIKIRGENFESITGFAKALKDHSIKVEPSSKKLIDVCGTGGDGSDTFNISTAVGFVIASAGLNVAKHGNVSISSKSGSADILREIGVTFSNNPKKLDDEINKSNFTFLFAPLMHPNMKYVMPVRTDLKIPSIFNIVGPLCNPYSLHYQVIGVYKESLLLPMAKAVQALGVERAAIVFGSSSVDELSLSGINKVIYIFGDNIILDNIDPADYGIKYASIEELKGGNPTQNLTIMNDIFNNRQGPKLDVVALNAGLALYIGEKTKSIKEGVEMAYKLIENSIVSDYISNNFAYNISTGVKNGYFK